MTTLMFVVPVHGRYELTRICLEQLARTCDALATFDIEADAVVVGDDRNLDTARSLGMGTVVRDNRFLSRKFNDGIQLACDPVYNPRPAEYVVPCGSDDWVIPELFTELPGPNSIVAFNQAAFVEETGTRISSLHIDYDAGVGIRIFPASVMERLDYRPADEDRKRACDSSILVNLKSTYRVPSHMSRRAVNQRAQGRVHQTRPRNGATQLIINYRHVHDFQIVDWKSPSEQLNPYTEIANRFHKGKTYRDPFATLAPYYPADAIEDMARHYGKR